MATAVKFRELLFIDPVEIGYGVLHHLETVFPDFLFKLRKKTAVKRKPHGVKLVLYDPPESFFRFFLFRIKSV